MTIRNNNNNRENLSKADITPTNITKSHIGGCGGGNVYGLHSDFQSGPMIIIIRDPLNSILFVRSFFIFFF